MSASGPGYTNERHSAVPGPVGMDYIPTDEERRVIKECNQESFWFRSVPLSVVSMAITQALVARGSLSASPRFGSLPKLVFSGFCGYLAGKLSYIKPCQEKIKRLENSPLAEAIRLRSGLPQQYSQGQQSEMGDANTSIQSIGTMFQSDTPSQTLAQSRDYGHGYSPDLPTQVERDEDLSVSDQSYMDDEEPRQKPILYEDLRLKNRENYEVTLTQKAETLLKPSSQREPERPIKEVKKNMYGDAWEE